MESSSHKSLLMWSSNAPAAVSQQGSQLQPQLQGDASLTWRSAAIAASAAQIVLLILLGLPLMWRSIGPLLVVIAIASVSVLAVFGAYYRRRWLVLPAAVTWVLITLLVLALGIWAMLATGLDWFCDYDSGCGGLENASLILGIALVAMAIPAVLAFMQLRFIVAAHNEAANYSQEMKPMPMEV